MTTKKPVHLSELENIRDQNAFFVALFYQDQLLTELLLQLQLTEARWPIVNHLLHTQIFGRVWGSNPTLGCYLFYF